MRVRVAASTLVALLASAGAFATTYTVTTAADSGAGSLRQAILDANANPGADTIDFAIGGGGVHTISPATPLPTITEALTINGYSQPGASANTNAPNQGTNAVIQIEIDGTNAGTFGNGLKATAVVTIRGLAINRCLTGAGVFIGTGGDGSIIAGNFLGTDPTGSSRPGAQYFGVEIEAATGVVVGGANPADRNVLSGGDLAQIYIGDSGGPNTVVKGNLIGTNAAGTSSVPGLGDYAQVYVRLGLGVIIGGPTAAERNVISGSIGSGNPGAGVGVGYTIGGTTAQATIQGNFIGTDVTGTLPIPNGNGIVLPDSNCVVKGNVISGNTLQAILSEGGGNELIQGNYIGTDETATLDLGNGGGGLAIGGDDWTIGGTGPGEGNVIAFNHAPGGIANSGNQRAAIRGNRMFGNTPLGIELYPIGVTPNDPGDGDSGPNGLQNFPIINSVTPGASTTNIQGILNSTASTLFDIDFYSGPTCLAFPQGFLQGENYLGSIQVSTDGSGNATFSTDVPYVLTAGQPVTATATDPSGNTSEFSQRILLSQTPKSGPPAGGTSASLNGMLFENGATVTVGGVAATGVIFNSESSITATMPARPAGTLSDVTVSNPSGTAGTLRNGWIADFGDVPGSQQFYTFITTLVSNQITVGCGSGNYCPDANVTRQQMAVFLLKGKHGLCYVPPACTPGYFDDVPCPSTYAAWIEALAKEGITGGCGGNSYCPTNPVRRDQMAVFLLKGEFSSSYTPPACTPPGVFPDVVCPGTFTDWIEELYHENIAAGCGSGNFCPTNPNNRGQMAVFITKTFNLQ